jgi:iron complex outermembrane recepter protein
MKSSSMRAASIASVGLLALSWSVESRAQEAVSADPAAAAQAANSGESAAAAQGEIIVTARREAENLQDVPVSVQVVTGETLQNQAITNAEEISKLAPGLTLVSAASSTVVTLRGITWQPGSGTPATPIYFNEAPFDPGNTITTLFDIGQIEVLRGPQGTSRGAPSISGAITITTRRPDLDEFGGYIQGLYGEGRHYDVQGAINVPIVKDMLAIRLAANIEQSDGNRIYSVNSSVRPMLRDRTFRATALFQPTDTISVTAMYQRRKTLKQFYTQVAGPGSPGFSALGIPANFNGPALTTADRRSVQDLPYRVPEHIDLLTVNASWEVLGHKLTYNFGRQFTRTGRIFNANDPLNIIPGYEPFNSYTNRSLPRFATHEVRVSSQPNPDRPFDYDLGWFSKKSGGIIDFNIVNPLPGAFGAPFMSVPGQVTTPVPRYLLKTDLAIDLGQVFDSFYGNVRFHLSDRTEFSAGLAIVRDRVPVSSQLTVGSGVFAAPVFLPAAAGGCPAPGLLPASPVYGAAYCDVSFPQDVRAAETFNNKYTAALYNFSLSHKFTDDLMVYATTGSSFRTGLPALNNPGLPADLLIPEPETAKSYEVGAKATFGRRLRASVAAFQLDYKNQLTSFQGISYFNDSVPGGTISQTFIAFYRNIDARVRGVELEIAAQPIDRLNLGFNLSYTKIKSQGGLVPCNDSIARPLNSANRMNFCPSPKGQVLNQSAPFQATLNGSYEFAVADAIDGYFRFNVNYQGENPNFGNFRLPDGSFKKAPAYAIVDLFAGVAGGDGAWNVGAYAKNVFNKQVELNRAVTTNSIFPLFAAPPGYDTVVSSRPREVGVSVRYAFGSR